MSRHNSNYYDQYDDVTDGEPPTKNNTSTRYTPSRPAIADEDTDYASVATSNIPARRTSTTDHTLRSQRSQYPPADVEWEAEPGRRYPARRDGKVIPRQQTSSQPARRTQPPQRAVQPQRYVESRQVNTGPVNAGRRRLVRNLFKGAVVVGLVSLPDVALSIGEGVNHYSQGDIPRKTMSRVVGHNNDSQLHPTILTVEVSDDHVNFVEKPAGNEKKTMTTPLPPFSALGFHGDISTLLLDIALQSIDAKKYSAIVSVSWYETWLNVIPHRIDKPFLLVDHGKGYFEATWS